MFYDGKIFLSSTDKSLIALNIETGKKLWEFKTEGKAAPRGLMISQENEPKVYFCDQFNLISLIPETGMPNLNFGKKGKVKLKHKCHVTPTIIGKNIVIATFEPGLEIYNLKMETQLENLSKKKEEKYFRYGGKRYDYSGGNVWGGISADVSREIVYVSTGNAGRFYAGVNRPGKNKYSNSVLAVSLKNKKIIWEFQEVEHDIWNFDIASPPILTSLKIDNKEIDVVVIPTKYGNTLVLDRLTGKNIYSYKNVKVPQSNIPGEKTAFYQKNLIYQNHFQGDTLNKITSQIYFQKQKNILKN